jgi:abequosyltransferase
MSDSTNSSAEAAEAVRLSICIPIYNFAGVIGQTLDSILPQLAPGVEVLVVDGASTDATPEIMAGRVAGCRQLRYVRLPAKGGIDADMAQSVALARGRYCWLFSGDDLMRPGALQRVLDSVGSGHDLYLCRHSNCDREMRFLFDYAIFRPEGARTVELGNPAARVAYLEQAINTEALFSFMSGLVVRRAAWESVPATFMGSCWSHVARLLSVAERSLRVRYVAETWLDKRGGNDSFMDQGFVNRLRIAVDGFTGIAAHFYGAGSVEAFHVRRLLRNELHLRVFIYARSLCDASPQSENRQELDRLLSVVYADPGPRAWLVRCVYRLTPALVLRVLREAYLWIAQSGARVRPPPA